LWGQSAVIMVSFGRRRSLAKSHLGTPGSRNAMGRYRGHPMYATSRSSLQCGVCSNTVSYDRSSTA
jgi:hypothetical protein